MRQTDYFFKTSKTAHKDDVSINARLLEQGAFIKKEMAGVYSFLPLGLRVLANIENIIREEMDKIGANEVLMPTLQPKENWIATGRWGSMEVLFKIDSMHGYQAALGPTHEEIVTPLAAGVINSYRDLPKAVYHIQTKFRDEARAKSGLLRGREFRMKDLYSFHPDEADLSRYYAIAGQAYHAIFKRLGLEAIYTEASGGSFSKYSHEFQVEIENGEDTIYVCNKCGLAKNKEIYTSDSVCTNCQTADFRETKASEVGNIFELKTKFSEAFGLQYTAEDGSRKFVNMGCYGIGSSRIMGVLVEKYNDAAGIIWPKAVAPFQVHLIALAGKDGSQVMAAAGKLYEDLQEQGISVLYDDREGSSAGEKFADSDLIGLPKRVVISARTLAENSVEIKDRNSETAKISTIKELIDELKN
jgi:prolyl-tRNA synthetase